MQRPWQSISNLRVRTVGIAVYPPGATFGPRRMHDYEFVWIIEGDAHAFYDQQEIHAPAGSLLLCRPGMTDRYEWSRERKTVHAFFHLDFDELPAGWPPTNAWPVIRRLQQDDVLRPLFRYVLRLHPLKEPMRSSLLVPCVELMLKSFVSGELSIPLQPYGELPIAVEKALRVIRDATVQGRPVQITLNRLAAEAHVTPEHLCRLFRKTIDLGPLECLRLARLERAATMLARSDLPVKQVTEAAGFSSPYHFSRRFREIYGLSPRAYRNAVREGETVKSNPISQALMIDFFSRPT